MQERQETLYHRLGEFEAILALTRRWHELCLLDPDAAHPFEHDLHPQHDERLAAYLTEAFGGPKLYTGGYGDESYVQRIHAGNGVHEELDEACLKQFEQALKDIEAPDEAAEQAAAYFRKASLEQRRYAGSSTDVPDDLPFNMVSNSHS